jgi:hypothetical protein
MRSHPYSLGVLIILGLSFFLLAGCAAPQAVQASMPILIQVDGKIIEQNIPSGLTVQQVLDAAGIQLGPLDQVQPPAHTLLPDGSAFDPTGGEPAPAEGDLIRVIRVTEEFTNEEETIPFERQVLQTESLPEGQQLLGQSGENGLQEISYRLVYEDGVEVSKVPVKWTVVKEATPEVMLVGIRAVFTTLPLPGRLAYLLGNNAWLMENTTAERRPVVTTGDLDGRVFSLSPDGTLLLFTRKAADSDQINTLWVATIDSDPVQLVDLKIENVVHFAEWLPGSGNTKVIFSTVEPRQAAPGWQANNDLNVVTFSLNGWVKSGWEVILEPNSGGVYGWWGTGFAWSPPGDKLAYVRPDELGLVDLATGALQPVLTLLPFQTHSDWAWMPGIGWGPDGNLLYTVTHTAEDGSLAPEESQKFDLTALSFSGGGPVPLAAQAGMFAYPAASPIYLSLGAERSYRIAYLQAIFEAQSESSGYRLVVMDRDGSNRQVLFPSEGKTGLKPQPITWSPAPLEGWGGRTDGVMAVIYQGNLWLVHAASAEAMQITGDGLSSRVSWR